MFWIVNWWILNSPTPLPPTGKRGKVENMDPKIIQGSAASLTALRFPREKKEEEDENKR